MTIRGTIRTLALAAAGALFAASALAQSANTPDPSHPGKAIYDKTCAMCHANPAPGSRAAQFSTIIGSSPAQLRETLTNGVMKPMAAGLSPEDMTSLIGYLTSGQKAVNANWTDAMMCPADDRAVDVTKPVAFGGFGVDPHSTRNMTAAKAGLKKSDMAHLQVAWAVGFPQTQSLGTGAAVLGDTVFVSGAGKLLALDAAKGCARWAKAFNTRNTPQIADLDGRKVLLLANGRNDLSMIDARTGDTVWTVNAQPSHDEGIGIRGGVVVYKDKIIVPYSASGVGTGQNAKFECCAFHGAVVALALKDGRKLWEYHTMKDAEYTGKVSKTGVKLRGPSGAPIWALPTIDEARNRVIVATGENTSFPGTNTSDALISLDLETGKPAWIFQAMALDVWNMSCNDRELQKSGPNCPNLYDSDKGRDFDFGATPILTKVGGRDIVFNGQKSGHVWGVDAATGKKVWVNRVGEGSALGGVHWGVAVDGPLGYAPIADSMFLPEEMGVRAKPGMYAFRLSDGKPAWSHPATADCGPARKPNVVACETKYGFSAAPLVIDGALVAATLDGKVVIFDDKTGAVLKTLDTTGEIKTVNGVPGRGGSIDSHAISAGDGMIFVTSGYGAFTQTPGNVLIALKPGK